MASSEGRRGLSGHRTEYAVTLPPRSALRNVNGAICAHAVRHQQTAKKEWGYGAFQRYLELKKRVKK